MTQIALGQAVVETPALPPDAFVEQGFFQTLLSGSFVAKLIPILIAVQIILLGVAEGLTRLAVITENKWDNKVANFLSNAAWIAGVLIGKVGYSTPKLVIEEKAKAAQKEPVSGV
jgi:hypothetical protein